MKLLKYQGRLPECVEGFPEDCERSSEKKGSLHLRPGQTIEMTDDEYAFIKANRPDLGKNLVLLRAWK
jgi:hypothetical protein